MAFIFIFMDCTENEGETRKGRRVDKTSCHSAMPRINLASKRTTAWLVEPSKVEIIEEMKFGNLR